MKFYINDLTEETKSLAIETFKLDDLNRFLIHPIKVIECRENENLIGCLIFQLIDKNIHSLFTIVNPEYRNLGIGSSLIEKLVQFGKYKGFIKITAQVKANNKASLKSISKFINLDFVIDRSKKEFYPNGSEKIILNYLL